MPRVFRQPGGPPLPTAIGAFSGALGASHHGSESKGEASLALRRRPEIEALFGAPGSATRRERDPFPFVARGGQDLLIAENRAFVELPARKELAYEYREISPRGHSWDFWDDHLRVFLNLLSGLSGFQKEGHPLHAAGRGDGEKEN